MTKVMDARGMSRDINGHAFIGTAPWVCALCGEVVPLNSKSICVPSPGCEVCGRSGKSAARCEFGARSGPCSCWRGVACGSPASL